MDLLESAIARPQATFRGENFYPDIFSKAAVLGHSLICNHPFIETKKEKAIAEWLREHTQKII